MSSTDAEAAIAKLQSLSDERASRVFSLIEDLAELEALEDAEDLKDARQALAELREGNAETQPTPQGTAEFANDETVSKATVPYERLRRELGLDH